MTDVKILLVEDESIEALDIKRTLESFGYEVPYVASSGEEALEKALEIMPDLILMDIILKGDSDGIETVTKIKNLNIPVIYFNCSFGKSTIERAKLTEPYGYIIRPYDRTELKYAIEHAIYKNKIKKQLKESEENFRAIAENSIDSILIAVEKGKHVYVNPKAVELTGYSKEELLNTHIEDIAHPDEIVNLKERYDLRMAGKNILATYETRIVRKDNEIVPIEISAAKTIWKDQPAVMVQVRDITRRKKIEREIKTSLEEKEMLLKEIHHRVKNNLMIISSLLNLQSSYIKDKTSQDIFKESQNRARSMALIHERLYQSTDLKSIDFGEYITSLATELFNTYEANLGLIKLKINAEDIFLDINTAIPLGLIVNELITNSITHAFPEGKIGEINVDFHPLDAHYEFIVKDNGIGFPEDMDFENTDSFGLKIINSLTNQIDGNIELNRNNGTEFKITFKQLEI